MNLLILDPITSTDLLVSRVQLHDENRYGVIKYCKLFLSIVWVVIILSIHYEYYELQNIMQQPI